MTITECKTDKDRLIFDPKGNTVFANWLKKYDILKTRKGSANHTIAALMPLYELFKLTLPFIAKNKLKPQILVQDRANTYTLIHYQISNSLYSINIKIKQSVWGSGYLEILFKDLTSNIAFNKIVRFATHKGFTESYIEFYHCQSVDTIKEIKRLSKVRENLQNQIKLITDKALRKQLQAQFEEMSKAINQYSSGNVVIFLNKKEFTNAKLELKSYLKEVEMKIKKLQAKAQS